MPAPSRRCVSRRTSRRSRPTARWARSWSRTRRPRRRSGGRRRRPRLHPAPTAGPPTMAMVGFGIRCSSMAACWSWRERSPTSASAGTAFSLPGSPRPMVDLTSPPEQKPPWPPSGAAPVRTITLASASSAIWRTASSRAAMRSPFSALRRAGRFSVMVPIRSVTSVRITGSWSSTVGSLRRSATRSSLVLRWVELSILKVRPIDRGGVDPRSLAVPEESAGDALMEHDPTIETAGPLVGLRVLDLSNSPAGAQATQTLADFGAEVVQVEPPGGSAAAHPAVLPLDRARQEVDGAESPRRRGRRSGAARWRSGPTSWSRRSGPA